MHIIEKNINIKNRLLFKCLETTSQDAMLKPYNGQYGPPSRPLFTYLPLLKKKYNTSKTQPNTEYKEKINNIFNIITPFCHVYFLLKNKKYL